MTYETMQVTRDGAIGQVRISRPEKRNSLPPAFWRELPEALASLDRTGEVRAVILSAAGDHFSAGMDVSVFSDNPNFAMHDARSRDAFIATGRGLLRVVAAIESARFPVIAAIQGYCLGGALELVAACDLRFATEDAQFRIEEINIGMMSDLGNLQRLPRLLPEAIAREMAYTGMTLTGARAAAFGFVNSVAADGDGTLTLARAAAEAIAARSPLAIRASKDALNYNRDHSIADALDRAMVMNGAVLDPHDMQESFSARRDKRPPRYANLAPLPPMSGV